MKNIFNEFHFMYRSSEVRMEDISSVLEGTIYFNEAYKIPIKNFVSKIKDIKNEKPSEYAGPEEIKEYVDKNYNDILKCTRILEAEPRALSDEERKKSTEVLIMFLGGMITVPLFGIGFIPALAAMIIQFIYAANVDKRMTMNNETIHNLSKIKKSLVSTLKNDNIDEATKRKISTMVDKIDDMEYEFQRVQKTQELQ